MKKIINRIFVLNQDKDDPVFWMLSLFYAVCFLTSWHYFFPVIIPRVPNVSASLQNLIFYEGMPYELGQSIKRVVISMLYSIPIAFVISFLGAVTQWAKPLAIFMKYFRFMSLLGFSAILRRLAGNGGDFQIYALMFGIIPWIITSFNTVFDNVHKDPLFPYARTMGYSELKATYYVVVRNKLAPLYKEIRNNFAIAWMMIPTVEVANRDGGGIGAMIFDKVRYINANDDIYAPSFALSLVVLLCGAVLDFLFRKLVLTLPEERIQK